MPLQQSNQSEDRDQSVSKSQQKLGGDNTSSNWALLAGLRFALAIDVLCGHMSLLFYGQHSWTYFGPWMYQESAVFGFFVVSGYSIAASIERSRSGYIRRRFLRIYPLYLVSIVVALIAALCLSKGYHFPMFPTGAPLPNTSTSDVAGSLVMLQLFVTRVIPLDGPTWSLGCEWWLYILALLFVKTKSRFLGLISLFSFAAFLGYQWHYGQGFEHGSNGRAFVSLAWLWISGFIYYRWRGTIKGFMLLLIPTAVATGLGFFTGLPLILTLLVVLFNERTVFPAVANRVLNWLGDVSYPMYLCHFALITVLFSLDLRSPVLLIAVVIVFSSLLLAVVDYPIRSMRYDPRKFQNAK